MTNIIINGEQRSCGDAQTVSDLLSDIIQPGSRVAVELNGEILPRGQHPTHKLADGDQLEIVQAIGGG
ncbi:MAG: sulfur carrier protein ThiS [Sinobacteraceae bacterium]|nr:sulfur carrier protein ThiS [Nevskiaceae bacterium]